MQKRHHVRFEVDALREFKGSECLVMYMRIKFVDNLVSC